MQTAQTALRSHLRAQWIGTIGLLASLFLLILVGLPSLLLRFPDHGRTWIVALSLVVVVGLGRTRLSLWMWQRPPLRELRRWWATCRFLGFWNQALDEGGDMITSLEKAARVSDDSELQQAVWLVIARLQAGKSLGQAFDEAGYFSSAVRECVFHSLQLGQLNDLLHQLRETPEVQLCLRASHLVEILTPMLLLLWGLLWVGLVDLLGQLF